MLPSITDWEIVETPCWGCTDLRVTIVHHTHWLNSFSHLLSCYRYSIDRRTDMDRLFNVHAGNGSVFLLKSLDREETPWHNISITATEFRKSIIGQDYFRHDVMYWWRGGICGARQNVCYHNLPSLSQRELNRVSRTGWVGNSQGSVHPREQSNMFLSLHLIHADRFSPSYSATILDFSVLVKVKEGNISCRMLCPWWTMLYFLLCCCLGEKL